MFSASELEAQYQKDKYKHSTLSLFKNSRKYIIRVQQKGINSFLTPTSIAQLMAIKHPNLLPLAQIIEDKQSIYFVEELINSKLSYSLTEFIKNRQLTDKEILAIFTQLTQGYSQLAALGIMHGNIKCKYILFDQGVWKLGGMGAIQKQSSVYSAPELNNIKRMPTEKSDIWSLGCILLSLILGNDIEQLFKSSMRDQQVLLKDVFVQNILHNSKFEHPIQTKSAKIIPLVLQQDPKARILFYILEKNLKMMKEGSFEEQSQPFCTDLSTSEEQIINLQQQQQQQQQSCNSSMLVSNCSFTSRKKINYCQKIQLKVNIEEEVLESSNDEGDKSNEKEIKNKNLSKAMGNIGDGKNGVNGSSYVYPNKLTVNYNKNNYNYNNENPDSESGDSGSEVNIKCSTISKKTSQREEQKDVFTNNSIKLNLDGMEDNKEYNEQLFQKHLARYVEEVHKYLFLSKVIPALQDVAAIDTNTKNIIAFIQVKYALIQLINLRDSILFKQNTFKLKKWETFVSSQQFAKLREVVDREVTHSEKEIVGTYKQIQNLVEKIGISVPLFKQFICPAIKEKQLSKDQKLAIKQQLNQIYKKCLDLATAIQDDCSDGQKLSIASLVILMSMQLSKIFMNSNIQYLFPNYFIEYKVFDADLFYNSLRKLRHHTLLEHIKKINMLLK